MRAVRHRQHGDRALLRDREEHQREAGWAGGSLGLGMLLWLQHAGMGEWLLPFATERRRVNMKAYNSPLSVVAAGSRGGRRIGPPRLAQHGGARGQLAGCLARPVDW